LLGSRRGAIGTRLLNLNDAASDHPEPMVQDIRPGGTGGESFQAGASLIRASAVDAGVASILRRRIGGSQSVTA